MADTEQRSYQSPSILEDFASYSYYHILLACDSFATADELSVSSEILQFKRVIFSNEGAVNYALAQSRASGRPLESIPLTGEYYGDKYQPRPVGRAGQYITLIDGSEDSDFTINAAKWATVFVPDTITMDGESYASTLELDGELEIIEPNGVNFLNVISQRVCDCLHTDPSGVVFVLKTIFVGQHESGSYETIPTVRPLLFTMLDISAEIDSGGAKYTLSFVGAENGTGKLQPAVAIANQVNLNIAPKMPLAAALAEYGEALNGEYEKQLAQFAEELNYADADSLKKEYRPVKYKIELDVDPNSADRYDDTYTITNIENIRTHNKDGDPVIASGHSTGVEEMIDRIMFSCERVILDGNPEYSESDKELTPRKAYKILSRLESDDKEFILYYKVVKYIPPLSSSDSIIAGGDLTPAHDSQILQFDYIFTGLNTSILDFKINMNMGMAFFQTMMTSGNVSGQENALNGQTDGRAAGPSDFTVASAGKNACSMPGPDGRMGRYLTPLFLGGEVRSNIVKNSKQPLSSASFRSLMNRWASFENLEAKIVIRGCVELLDQVLDSADAQTIERVGLNTDNRDFDAREKQFVNLNVPNFIKLNIKMPDSNGLFPEYSPFWYQGFFYVLSVNNMFDGGNFTQEVEMMSIPQVNEEVTITDTKKQKGTTTSNKQTKSQGQTGKGTTPRQTQTKRTVGDVMQDQGNIAANNAARKGVD